MDRTTRATIALRMAAVVAAVSLLLAACGSSSGNGAGDGEKMSGFAFSPASMTSKAATALTWTNADNATHTVTADDGSFDSGNVASGATFTRTFATAGTFAYHCNIHSSMHGTITVTQ